jgi:hypothetical protein
LVGTWLAGPSKVDLGDGAFMGEKVLSKLFVKLKENVKVTQRWHFFLR